MIRVFARLLAKRPKRRDLLFMFAAPFAADLHRRGRL
jgi:hypothetical protein